MFNIEKATKENPVVLNVSTIVGHIMLSVGESQTPLENISKSIKDFVAQLEKDHCVKATESSNGGYYTFVPVTESLKLKIDENYLRNDTAITSDHLLDYLDTHNNTLALTAISEMSTTGLNTVFLAGSNDTGNLESVIFIIDLVSYLQEYLEKTSKCLGIRDTLKLAKAAEARGVDMGPEVKALMKRDDALHQVLGLIKDLDINFDEETLKEIKDWENS